MQLKDNIHQEIEDIHQAINIKDGTLHQHKSKGNSKIAKREVKICKLLNTTNGGIGSTYGSIGTSKGHCQTKTMKQLFI